MQKTSPLPPSKGGSLNSLKRLNLLVNMKNIFFYNLLNF